MAPILASSETNAKAWITSVNERKAFFDRCADTHPLVGGVKNADTTGFSRVVLQLQPSGAPGLAMFFLDTTDFSRVVFQLRPSSMAESDAVLIVCYSFKTVSGIQVETEPPHD